MMKFAVLFISALMLTGCGSTWIALRENRQGIADIKTENPTGAMDHFIRGLGEEPFRSELHHNLGLTFDLLKRPDDAEKSYQNAEKLATNAASLFAARYNLAEGYGRAKKTDLALEWYQKALELKPDSVEVKTNIELLINQNGQGQGQKDQKQQQGQGKDDKNQKDKQDSKGDQKDQKDPKDRDKDGKEKENKQYEQSGKYKPRPFQGDLSEGDVKKILGEIKQQEQRIRAEYNRKDSKENKGRPRDKDW